MFVKKIDNAINQANRFIVNSVKEIKRQGQIIYGFPHFNSKQRITEYGGTSSALSALYISGQPSNEIKNKSVSALSWLFNRQNIDDGSWQSSQLYCSEVTAGILIDLTNLPPSQTCNFQDAIKKAIKYINSCYVPESGNFKTTPINASADHIFTTYICVKALIMYNSINNSNKEIIKKWIKEAHSDQECGWGITPKSNEIKISSTIFALKTLLMCGVESEELRKKYKKDIIYLKNAIKICGNNYESEDLNNEIGSDECGVKYQTLKFAHYTAALLGDFFIEINEKQCSMNVINELINNQFAGGWGISKDFLSMWATNQAIITLIKFKKNILPNLHKYQVIFFKIPFFITKIILSVLIIVSIIILSTISRSSRETLMVSCLLAFIPWAFKRNF